MKMIKSPVLYWQSFEITVEWQLNTLSDQISEMSFELRVETIFNGNELRSFVMLLGEKRNWEGSEKFSPERGH